MNRTGTGVQLCAVDVPFVASKCTLAVVYGQSEQVCVKVTCCWFVVCKRCLCYSQPHQSAECDRVCCGVEADLPCPGLPVTGVTLRFTGFAGASAAPNFCLTSAMFVSGFTIVF